MRKYLVYIGDTFLCLRELDFEGITVEELEEIPNYTRVSYEEMLSYEDIKLEASVAQLNVEHLEVLKHIRLTPGKGFTGRSTTRTRTAREAARGPPDRLRAAKPLPIRKNRSKLLKYNERRENMALSRKAIPGRRVCFVA